MPCLLLKLRKPVFQTFDGIDVRHSFVKNSDGIDVRGLEKRKKRARAVVSARGALVCIEEGPQDRL